MPGKPKRPCGYFGCRALSTESYCEEHRKQIHLDYKRDRTDKEEQAFYTSGRWRKVRSLKLSADPLCEECKRQGRIKEASMVDHIVPIKKGGARLDMDNLQSLCRPCHNRKTATEHNSSVRNYKSPAMLEHPRA